VVTSIINVAAPEVSAEQVPRIVAPDGKLLLLDSNIFPASSVASWHIILD